MKRNHLISIIFLLILFGFIMRFVPHAPNMTPITALILISSLYLSKRVALVLPFAILLVSDFAIGFYDWRIMLSVYGSFALIALLSWQGAQRRTVFSVALLTLASPFLFFFITNTAVWFFSPWYAKSMTGLMYAYELGIPFLRNMFVGDVLYTSALIGIVESVYFIRSRKRTYTHHIPTAPLHPSHTAH